MKILVAHNVRRGRSGGMSRIMGFIHDRIQDGGHSVTEFTTEDAPPAAQGRWERFVFPRAVALHAIQAHRSGAGYDIINVHEPSAAAVLRNRRLLGAARIVVTSHGVEQRAWELALEERRLGRRGPSLKTRLLYPATRLRQAAYSLKNADHVLCLNTEDMQFISARYGRHIESITRIFPGADPHFAAVQSARDYTRCRTLLFAGTWRKNKGIEDLVPAFCSLATRHECLRLVMLGPGIPKEQIVAAFSPSAQARIEVRQGYTEAELSSVYAEADIMVLPSLFEGTPLVLIEAMMSGLPIVTTSTCGMKDVIAHEQNGLLIPIRSSRSLTAAVEHLIASEELRETLGRRAHQDAVENYTWDKVADPVRRLYERIARSSRL